MNHWPGSPPGALAPLYGREHDLRQVLKLLQDGVRLLTLRGPGGIGKTALALHLACALRTHHSSPFGHVQFIDLSAVREPEQVLGQIAAALPDQSLRGTPERRIQTFAARQRTLLILDTFEQLLPAAPERAEVLAATGTLQLLVTSRSALRLHDETEYPVLPLALPRRAQSAAASGAVQLFVARVQALTPSFTVDQHNAGQVMRLCEVLEGIPLALDLAAMRTRTYALGDLLTQLEHPLNVLRADFRDRPERLRSLRATVQWSYDLLDEVDRAVFECCAVFSGPFTPQALAEVWGDEGVLERAEALLAQSLLQRLDTAETLWNMLQPLRELAEEHLENHPKVALWRERHARHFLDMVEEEWGSWEFKTANSWDTYLPHYPNIRAGLVWTVGTQRSELAYRYLGALRSLWASFRLFAQEWPLVEQVLALPEPEDRGTLLLVLEISADSLRFTGQFQACETRLREIMALCRELHDVESLAWADLELSTLALDTGQAERAWETVQRVIRELGERLGEQQPPPTNKQRFLWARAHKEASRDLLELGRHAEALEYAQLACEYNREAGNRYFELNSMVILGRVLLYVHRQPEARALLLSCLHEAVKTSLRGVVIYALRWGLTVVAAEQKEWTTLVQFAAFVNDAPGWERSHSVPDRRLRQDMARAREALGESAYQQAWTAGTHLHIADVVDLAERLAQGPVQPVIHPDLTPRELEVLALVAHGHPDRKVAQLLKISPGTASKHVANLLGKLGLHNRVELARWALAHDLADRATSGSPLP